MNCPNCSCENAYVGFQRVDCCNKECSFYNQKHASDVFSKFLQSEDGKKMVSHSMTCHLDPIIDTGKADSFVSICGKQFPCDFYGIPAKPHKLERLIDDNHAYLVDAENRVWHLDKSLGDDVYRLTQDCFSLNLLYIGVNDPGVFTETEEEIIKLNRKMYGPEGTRTKLDILNTPPKDSSIVVES